MEDVLATQDVGDSDVDWLRDGNAEDEGYASPERLEICSIVLVSDDLCDCAVSQFEPAGH